MNNGELIDQFEISQWLTGIQVAGDTAFVFLSGGVGLFDLNKRAFKTMTNLPENHFFGILVGPNGVFYATGRNGLYQFDDKGQLLNTTLYPKPFIDGGYLLSASPRLIGIWDGHAVLASKHAVHVLKL